MSLNISSIREHPAPTDRKNQPAIRQMCCRQLQRATGFNDTFQHHGQQACCFHWCNGLQDTQVLFTTSKRRWSRNAPTTYPEPVLRLVTGQRFTQMQYHDLKLNRLAFQL
jgi:hypothetical protein